MTKSVKKPSVKRKRRKPLSAAPGSQFLAWMHRNFTGFFYPAYPCWNWRIGGVLVTHWNRNEIVKIYHDQGRQTEFYHAGTEACREAIMSLANTKSSHGPEKP